MKEETLKEREPYWDLVDAKAEQNNTIDLEKSSKEDILHLIADDYVLKYLSGRKEIAEKTKNINREE